MSNNVSSLIKLAEGGNVSAMYTLSQKYLVGDSVEKDISNLNLRNV